MSRSSTIVEEKTGHLEMQPSSLLADRFVDIDVVKTEEYEEDCPEPTFKEKTFDFEEKPQFEQHELLQAQKAVESAKRKRLLRNEKRKVGMLQNNKNATRKKLLTPVVKQYDAANDSNSLLMGQTAPDIFEKDIKKEEENDSYGQATFPEPLFDPAIHCVETAKQPKKNVDKTKPKQKRQPLFNYFNPPQRPLGLRRPIPEMTLSAKVEDFEIGVLAENMMLGLWHTILIPSNALVQQFYDLELTNMAGTTVCENYIMQDVVHWTRDSVIYNGWDDRANRVCIKICTVEENRDLLHSLKNLRHVNPHLVIPLAVGTLGRYHISVSTMFDVDLEKIRRLYHFALTDDQILKVLTQLISAVAEVHKLGFIHADVCPANLLLKTARLYNRGNHAMLEDIHILLSDYNGCIYLSDKEKGQKVGVIQQTSYRSPEVLLGHNVNFKVDMWSIGLVGIDLIYPGHWSLEEYDVNDPVKAGEHLYRIDRNIYSIDWNMFSDTFSEGNQDVYWSYQDYYKKRLKLNFPPYNDTEEKLRELLKSLLQTNPHSRVSSEDAASQTRYLFRDEQDVIIENE